MLAKEYRRLSNMKSTVLLSNSNSALITDLYKDFNIMTISTSRPINCNASNRLNHHELLITNKRLLVTNAVINHAETMPEM
jgi:DNA adenine methylase